MAWITFKDPLGNTFRVPEGVYKTYFKNNEAFTLVQESKPAPTKKIEEKKEEIVNDEQIQQPKSDENIPTRKGTKKVS